MLKQYKIRDYDFKLVIYIILITVIGILAIGSANGEFQGRQMAGACAGLVIMICLSLVDYTLILKLQWVFYILNLVLLILVQLFGDDAGGAQRWIQIAGIRFQPSETAKILLILFYAEFIMIHKEKFNTLKNILMFIVFLIPPWLLVYKQPDLSTSIMILIVFAVIMFVGGLSTRVVVGIMAVVIPVALIFLSLVLQPDQNLIKDYQQTRILAFLHPEEYANAEAYQQNNSVMAIGSGQLFGKGYKNNEITSVKNGNFISEPQTDFIFAIVGEEFGFVGSCTVIVLLFQISMECFSVARRSRELSGTIIGAGMGALVGAQGFLNIGVATFLLPNTGLPLPFVSYGLTSLLSLFIGMGFVLNVSLQCSKN
ncbi:MAG: FtsW/RodA/SpoVE family cell cycle protein [Lachnospiraceae bacterium]|nr:FtsW/RodA/SpoVE family cell cycle protein [Lachnospiraceae bacterium]